MNNIKTETERRSRHAEGGDPHHYPYARHVRTGWKQDADGAWSHEGEDAHLWEVFCAEWRRYRRPGANCSPPKCRHCAAPTRGAPGEARSHRHFKLT